MNALRVVEFAMPGPDKHRVSELFHRLNRVLPDSQVVVSISPDTKVAEAIELMRRHHFSQLPVLAGNEVLGIFSYKSFAERLVKMASSGLKGNPCDLVVDEFIEQVHFARVTDEFRSVFEHLERDNVVLVGEPNRLQGVLTAMDILNYLYGVASPFVLVAEIELALRALIHGAVGDEGLVECAKRCLSAKYTGKEHKLPTTLDRMTFDEYVQLVNNKDNWVRFAHVFGGSRERTAAKLAEVGTLRNDIFHFKREISWEEHECLSIHRDWILRRARMADGKQSEGAA